MPRLINPLPRLPRIKRAHVKDAGEGILFECRRCKWSSGWIAWAGSVSKAKRGIPCGVCNGGRALG